MNLTVLPKTESSKKNFYPTSKAIAEKMLSGIDLKCIEKILEPSAGKGDLAKALVEALSKHNSRLCSHDFDYQEDGTTKITDHYRYNEADIDCVEIDHNLRAILSADGFRVVHDDFLTYETFKQYDLIIMNPPFDRGAEHLDKALDMCEKGGGTVVCLLNAETLKNAYSLNRKMLVERLEGAKAKIEYFTGLFLTGAERCASVETAIVTAIYPKPVRNSDIMEGMRKAPSYNTARAPEEYLNLIKANKFDAWVDKFNYETACGLKLIEEWCALKPYLLENLESTPYNKPILSLEVAHRRGSLEDNYLRATRKKYWSALFQHKDFTAKLTSNLVNELRSSVDELSDYEFSTYNLLTVAIKMSQGTNVAIEKTIIDLFDDWTKMYWNEESPNRHYFNGWKTNDCFAIGKKVILPFYGAYSDWDGRFRSYNVTAKMSDIEKVFDFLDMGRTEGRSIHDIFRRAEELQNTRKIQTKYFYVTLYKKGTAHFEFINMELLQKFNLFAARHKKWLPPCYGKKAYEDLDHEEKAVIDSFEGKESYERVMARPDYFLRDASDNLLMMPQG